MLTVHHLKNTQCFPVMMLLEELQMEYKVHVYDWTKELKPPDEYIALSPLGTSPTIVDDSHDGEPLVLNEANTILEYILDMVDGQDKGTKMRPSPGSPERLAYLKWYYIGSGTTMTFINYDQVSQASLALSPRVFRSLLTTSCNKMRQTIAEPRMRRMLEEAEKQLSQHAYLAGSYMTLADLRSLYAFDYIDMCFAKTLKDYPNCAAWLKRMQGRTSYKEVLKRVGQDRVSKNFGA
jgi:glutathione S-transferase